MLDQGPSDDPQLYIFRFDGKKLSQIGEVYAWPMGILFDGAGGFRAMERGAVLHTWFGMRGYALRGGKVQAVPETYIVMNTLVRMVQPLKV